MVEVEIVLAVWLEHYNIVLIFFLTWYGGELSNRRQPGWNPKLPNPWY